MNDINEKYSKPWKEKLGSYLKHPSREALRDLIDLESVEDNDLEFKEKLIEPRDIAKHALAMANTHGGAIVFGIKEERPNDFSPKGISGDIDVTDLEKKVERFLPEALQRKFHSHMFDDDGTALANKLFWILIVQYIPQKMPFLSRTESADLRKTIIYVRRNRASEPATHEELQAILNRRIETQYSTSNERRLAEHLEELKKLYSYIPEKLINMTQQSVIMLDYHEYRNPHYPEETFENFVGRLIEVKKEVIIQLVKSSF